MNYRQRNELIVTTPRSPTDTSIGKYIHKEKKQTEWGRLNYTIGGEVRQNDLVLRWKDFWSHTVNDVFNYCPMFLNYLAIKGYKKILFVGHYNAAQTTWTINRKMDRVVHKTPSYHSLDETMVDPNIWLQFLPIVRMAYGYIDFEMHTVSPPESRHRKVMNALYKRYNVDLVNSDKQYKKGRNVQITTPPDTQYDCVVLAGVPKDRDDLDISHHHIRSAFAGVCTSDFDIVDFYYSALPLQTGVSEDNAYYLNEVFALRNVWDQRFRDENPEDKAIQYAILNDSIHCYKGS